MRVDGFVLSEMKGGGWSFGCRQVGVLKECARDCFVISQGFLSVILDGVVLWTDEVRWDEEGFGGGGGMCKVG